jgi:hypothetical protein
MLFCNEKRQPLLSAIVALGGAIAFATFSTASQADKVYKFIGPDGSVTYSDTLPADTEEYDELDMPEAPAVNADAHRQTTQEMSKTADRLREDRISREKARELEKILAPVPPTVVFQQPDNNNYRRPYWYGRDRYRDRRDRIRPPYRLDRQAPRSTEERLKENLRSPLNIPRFGD